MNHSSVLIPTQISFLTAVQYPVILYGKEDTMQETKLTIRLPRELLENAKRYARRQNTTVTNLISAYLRRMPASIDILEEAPIVRRLSGTLSRNVSITDYQKHLEAKYGGKN